MQQIQNTYDDFNDTINYLDKLHNLCLPNQLKRIIQDSKDLSNTEKENLINELNTKSIDTIVSDLAVSNVDLLLKFNKIINETEMVTQVIDVRNEILK
jgi:ribonuclease HII